MKVPGQLCDGGGLADSVDAQDKQDVQRARHDLDLPVDDVLSEDRLERFPHALAASDAVFARGFPQTLDDLR